MEIDKVIRTGELPESLYNKIQGLCANGDDLVELGRHADALDLFREAWNLIPEPKDEWEASTWVLGAIGDSCFSMGYRDSAREALSFAMRCPGGLGNPFLHLRLGQVMLDSGQADVAADELMRAYMAGGLEVFLEEDPKYLNFLRTRAVIS